MRRCGEWVGSRPGAAVTDGVDPAQCLAEYPGSQPDPPDQVVRAGSAVDPSLLGGGHLGADTDRETDTNPHAHARPPSPSSSSPPSQDPGSSGEAGAASATATPSWVWWLLGALLVAAAVAIPLWVHTRKGTRWRAELAESEGEIAWFVRVLIPELQQAGSPAEVRGGWGVGEPRVVAVEDRLTELAASAPDDGGRARAVELRDAVRTARERIRAAAASPQGTAVSGDLGSAASDLTRVWGPAASTGS